ncbi:TNFR-Cys domain-containing protein [Trichonephila inaurata madagascariensis]|uniref:TNFR-Cys domain-containing protein n=1 Tax=Trichonephila inaurata madagascariensis TaxID=2747483 RepID=A0A8X7C059_9ARAC|nr:TNFR-Cys domain-containing protein [Trichonephila inaurata madagascariensis]
MKKGYLEFDLLFLFVYITLNFQFAMAKHPHHHHVQNKDCYRCPPGYGVERHCSRFHDTECGACAPDHYSNHLSAWRPCYPCSRCGAGLYVAHKCTAARDTVCDSCHTYRGPHNEDFYERCVKPLLENAANSTNSVHSQSSQAKESESVVAVDMARGVPASVIVASGVVIGALAVVLLLSCFVATRRKQSRRSDQRYSYVAVSTKEAVML